MLGMDSGSHDVALDYFKIIIINSIVSLFRKFCFLKQTITEAIQFKFVIVDALALIAIQIGPADCAR